MKTKFNAKDILVPSVALFLIALVCTLLLAIVNNLTADKIAEQTAATEAAARTAVMADAVNFAEKDGYFEALDAENNVIGYVFNTTSRVKGYASMLTCTVGVDTEGKVTGIVPGDLSNETPGLGQNASKESFTRQFIGLTKGIEVVKTAPAEGANQIQAITSSTITSNAITDCVNVALEQYETITGGGN